MIISASRRTDIPAFYSDWFFQRLKEGYVLVKNPVNPHRISRVFLNPEVVDAFVFWTKNPTPMLGRLDMLSDYPFYFQFTLTPYGPDVEPGIPAKGNVVIPTFQKIATVVGRERVVWRYDPILLSDKYTLDYHLRAFRRLCDLLADSTEICTVSFLDLYKNIQKPMASLGVRVPGEGEMLELAGRLSAIAREYGLGMVSCAEKIDLSSVGIKHASCIDKSRIERIGGFALAVDRDKNQRQVCGCVESVDIGSYGCCRHGCRYCYACRNEGIVMQNLEAYDPTSPILCSGVEAGDIITDRKMPIFRRDTISLL